MPSLVLEHSIRSRCPDAEIVNTYHLDRPVLRHCKNPTPFSLVRWWVPQLLEYEGWAIYLDADMVALSDIRELWDCVPHDDTTPPVLSTLKTTGCSAVMMYDCSRLRSWDAVSLGETLKNHGDYGKIVRSMNGEKRTGDLPGSWNMRDKFRPGETDLIHFSALSMQPWKFPTHARAKHPHSDIWGDALLSALEAGVVSREQLDANIMEILKNAEARKTVNAGAV